MKNLIILLITLFPFLLFSQEKDYKDNDVLIGNTFSVKGNQYATAYALEVRGSFKSVETLIELQAIDTLFLVDGNEGYVRATDVEYEYDWDAETWSRKYTDLATIPKLQTDSILGRDSNGKLFWYDRLWTESNDTSYNTGSIVVNGFSKIDSMNIGMTDNFFTSNGSLIIGIHAGDSAITSPSALNNVFIGSYAGEKNEKSDNNVAIGANAFRLGFINSSDGDNGDYNVAIGAGALQNGGAAGYTTAIGYEVLTDMDYAHDNTAIGFRALRHLTGYQSWRNNVMGYLAGEDILKGLDNQIIGSSAMNRVDTASYNIALGTAALNNFTKGSLYNVGIGYMVGSKSGVAEDTLKRSVWLGAYAGSLETKSHTLYIESEIDADSASSLIYGEFDNDFIRLNADILVRDDLDVNGDGTILGGLGVTEIIESGDLYKLKTNVLARMVDGVIFDSWYLAGSGNAIATGIKNVGMGESSLFSLTDGYGNTSIGSGNMTNATEAGNNTSIGTGGLSGLTVGTNNVSIGFGAGSFTTTGNGNVFIGNLSGAHAIAETVNSELWIDNTNIATPLIWGNFDTGSVKIRDTLEVGNGVNGTLIVNGDSRFNGDVTYEDTFWDDQQVSIGNVQLHPSNTPTWTSYKGGYVLSFDEGDDDEIYFNIQLTHAYKHGSDIEFHLHLVFPNGNSGNVNWVFTYSWANIGDDFPTETTVDVNIASSGDTDQHALAEIASTLTGTSKEGSSVLICSLTRNGTDGTNDTYGSDVYLIAEDCHIELDKPGSDNETP